MDKIDGVFTIGYPEKNTVTEIEESAFHDFIINTKEEFEIVPKSIILENLTTDPFLGTLVQIKNVQLVANEIGKAFTFYSGNESAVRNLETCGVSSKLGIKTNGAANFSNDKFPIGKGSVTGILYKNGSKFEMEIRKIEDILFDETYEACPVIIPKIMITEIADPSNSTTSRFVELYNAGATSIELTGWKLNKYLNGANSVSGTALDLSGFAIAPNEFLIISNLGFEAVFGFASNISSTYISANGDDVYELVDAAGVIQDVFGEVGVDGSGLIWEYLDGSAVRKKNVNNPNAVFDIAEWEVFSKTKGIKQIAPDNFDPGVR